MQNGFLFVWVFLGLLNLVFLVFEVELQDELTFSDATCSKELLETNLWWLENATVMKPRDY